MSRRDMVRVTEKANNCTREASGVIEITMTFGELEEIINALFSLANRQESDADFVRISKIADEFGEFLIGKDD